VSEVGVGGVGRSGDEAGDGDVAALVVQARQRAAERGQRVADGPAEHAGVRLPLQHRDLDRHVDQPAQARGQRRHVDGGVRRVRDDDDVAGQGVAVLLQQRCEGGGARLLLTLDEQRDARPAAGPVGAQDREVGHDAGLVVGRATRRRGARPLGGLERRAGPQVVAARGCTSWWA
jgi:hypothetical protein